MTFHLYYGHAIFNVRLLSPSNNNGNLNEKDNYYFTEEPHR